MRPIDADALMEQPVWLCGGWVGDPYAEGYMDALDKVEETVRSAPTINAMSGWISCDDRLPEPTQEVLVTGINNCVYTSRIVHGEFEYGGNVIAWMPLPEPYEGERRDDEDR